MSLRLILQHLKKGSQLVSRPLTQCQKQQQLPLGRKMQTLSVESTVASTHHALDVITAWLCGIAQGLSSFHMTQGKAKA